MAETGQALNTDRELWREVEGDFYAPSLHVTEGGGIGMNVGGRVIVMPIREWHLLATEHEAAVSEAVREERERCAKEAEAWASGSGSNLAESLNRLAAAIRKEPDHD